MAEKTAFPGMHQLSDYIYLHKPIEEQFSSSNNENSPKLTVLCTWMSAAPVHITKYIKSYQALYPHACILLIRTGPLDFAYHTQKTLERRLTPAVDVVRSICPLDSQHSPPRVLLHIFSNGGSLQAVTLLRSYRAAVGQAFPVHATLMDSCPGPAKFDSAFRTLTLPLGGQPALIRLPMSGLIYALFGLWWNILFALGAPDPHETLWEGLNDKGLVKETKRVYIYSEADDMMDWQGVEEHARVARRRGWRVEMEKFEGSRHVAHVRVGDGVRYWGIVEKLWKGSNEPIG